MFNLWLYFKWEANAVIISMFWRKAMAMSLYKALGEDWVISSCSDAAYANTLRLILDKGQNCTASTSLSRGSNKSSKEILNFSCLLDHPLQRLPVNKKLNLPAAVARFVWMMAGSDRLADIAFYEPKAIKFSDDGISMPGSSYGQRILRARPGLNQLESAIQRLKQDPATRRSAISIYHPEDAVRESKDIPCAFGIFYRVLEGRLIATTLMRSNNAFVLMPYNIFEFSLLAEAVSVETGIPFGGLVHSAISMHIYAENFEAAQDVIASYDSNPSLGLGFTCPPIPFGSSPLESIKKLVILEADLRHASAGLCGDNIEEWIEQANTQLDYYWRQLFFLLLLHVAKKNRNQPALYALQTVIVDPWKLYLGTDAFQLQDSPAQATAQLLELELPVNTYKSTNIIPFYKAKFLRSLKQRAAAFEESGKGSISWRDFSAMEEALSDQIAASGADSELSDAEFERLLNSSRTQQGELSL